MIGSARTLGKCKERLTQLYLMGRYMHSGDGAAKFETM